MTGAELWRCGAVTLARMVRRREVSAVEVAKSCLARLDDVNPAVNAVVNVMAADALVAAEAADLAIRRGEPIGPLHGVPVTVKVNTDVQGHATTEGVSALAHNVAQADSAVVGALRRAGAVILGQTNCQAFCVRWFNDNDLYGPARNPWDDAVTPGGSSGGAAVAVATGIAPLGFGTDAAGSVRYPAYACGVAGLRPTSGRIASYNPSNAALARGIGMQLVNTEGLLARTVADIGLALSAVSEPDARDPNWVPVDPRAFSSAGGPRAIGVGGLEGAGTLAAEMVQEAAKLLGQAGHEVEPIEPPAIDELAQMWLDLMMSDARAGGFADLIGQLGDPTSKVAIGYFMELAKDLDFAGCSRLFTRREQIRAAWNALFGRVKVVVIPCSRARAFRVGEDLASLAAFRAVVTAQAPLLAPAMLGFPALTVPLGIGGDGLPRAVQIVGPPHGDRLCLEVGGAIEALISRLTPIDPVGGRRPGLP